MGLFDFFKRPRRIDPKTQMMIDRIRENANTPLVRNNNTGNDTLTKKDARLKANDMLQSGNLTGAINLYTDFKRNTPYKGKGSGFFIEYSNSELKEIFNKITNTSVFDDIGFPKEYINKFKEVYYELYLFGDINLEKRFEEILPGSVDKIKKSRLIKNKDVPFLDLKNLINGEKVIKFKIK